jgi:hypothetical protein
LKRSIARLELNQETGHPISCADTSTVRVHYVPMPDTPALKGYSVRVVVAGGQVTFTPADITVNTLPAGSQVSFQIYQNAPNDCTVDYTILGTGTPGIATTEDLFTIDFAGAESGITGVRIVQVDFRNLQNQPFSVEHTDRAMVSVDCDPPHAVTTLVALPGHHRVEVKWTDPVDQDLTSVKVLRGMWQDNAGASAYPLYGRLTGSSPPARPASLEAALASGRWAQVAEVAPGVELYVDVPAQRGIYYYEAFGVDDVANASAPATTADRATNYWLGDFDGNGNVDIFDLTILGDSYGVSSSHPSFSALADIGPTDDGSGTGIPLPDGFVGFEDMMICGQTFGEVAPRSRPSGPPDLLVFWRQEGEHEWSCRLATPCAALKGLRLTADLPDGVSASLGAGTLLSDQVGPVFLQNAGDDLDVGLCLLGQGLGFVGDGELFRVHLTGEADLHLATIEARDVVNENLEVTTTTAVGDVVPRTFAAGANFPNPFNAATTIQFDLPDPQWAEVVVYSIDGRRVRTLLSQQMPAGRHTVNWNGTDDRGAVVASGTYFYRIEAGPYRATRKMVVAK